MDIVDTILNDAKASPVKEPLEANREAILILRKKGYSWRDISDFLKERGVSATHTKIYRFINKSNADKESNTMNQGLYISDNYYINLAKVKSWTSENNHMQLHLATTEDTDIVDIVLKEENSIFSGPLALEVEINEFKRIEREINEFMGLAST